MFAPYFWRATVERAVKSFAQALIALLSASSLGILDVAWVTTLSTAGMTTLLSVLTSVASVHVGPADDPSVLTPAPVAGPDAGPVVAAAGSPATAVTA